MRRREVSGECIAPRRTTALREAANYGLRGWISTRSNDLARLYLAYLPRYRPGYQARPFVGADRAAFPKPVRRNALGIYQGSASGMKMSKGQTGRRLLGVAVAGMALL